MPPIPRSTLFIVLALLAVPPFLWAQEPKPSPNLKKVAVADGVELHYIERGNGVPVIFVHGGLQDYTSFESHLGPLAESYRAISYSRRYSYPNTNKFQPTYSQEIEAEDLAALIKNLGLEKAHIVGHSSGGLIALCLAIKHPALVRTLTLAEPPVHFKGDPIDEDSERRNKAAREAFEKGEPEKAIRMFIEGAMAGTAKWDQMPEGLRKRMLRNARELEAVTKGDWTLIDRDAVRKLAVPTLFLTGETSPAYLKKIEAEMMRLIPETNRQQVVIPGASHGMFYTHAEACRRAMLEFFRGK